nr:gag pol polyprotein [Hymenolepis microstoma]CUU99092.1 gag pol polyprotein [Hymenolepis microstoma]
MRERSIQLHFGRDNRARNSVKEDLGCCPAELALDTTLRLPGEMTSDSQDQIPIYPSSYSARLKDHFRSVLPTPTLLNNKPTHIHKDLSTCPFVFVQVDTVKKPLQPPYDGPYKVLKRTDILSLTIMEPRIPSTIWSSKDTIPSSPITTILSQRYFKPFSSSTCLTSTQTLLDPLRLKSHLHLSTG